MGSEPGFGLGICTEGRKGSGANPNLVVGALGAYFGELGQFALAVEQKEVTPGPRGHRPTARRHADPRKTGHQYGSRTAPEHL